MRRKSLILVALTGCFAVLSLTYRLFPERRSGVPATVKVINAGDVKSGYRVWVIICSNGLVPDPSVVRGVLVLAVNAKDGNIIVDVTSEQADKLSRLDRYSPFILGAEDFFDPPWWWTRLMRLKGLSDS